MLSTLWGVGGEVGLLGRMVSLENSPVRTRLPVQETGIRFCPWAGKIPWRRKWQPTPVFLPGEFHGQKSLAGYSLWGRKELDMTEGTLHVCT